MNLQEYIDSIKIKIPSAEIIESFEIVDERTLMNRGYFRAPFIWCNGDFLEIAESFREDIAVRAGMFTNPRHEEQPKVRLYRTFPARAPIASCLLQPREAL